MKTTKFFLIIFIAAVLEATLLDCFKLFGVKPNLLLACVVIASIFPAPFKPALALSLFAGLLKDIFTINSFGLNTVIFPLCSILVRLLSKRISLDNNLICAGAVFIIALFNNIITKVIFVFSGRLIPAGPTLAITFLNSFYTALIFLLIARIFK